MSLVILYLVVVGLSLLGSLPPGMISLTTTLDTLKGGLTAGLKVALGAVLVEWVQAFISVRFAFLFTVHPEYETVLLWISMIVFFVLAMYYLFFTGQAKQPSREEKGIDNYFLKGLFLSSTNVMVLPYWIFYSTYLGTQGWMGSGIEDTIIFSTAASTGSFLALWGYCTLASRVLSKIENIRRIANKVVGCIFMGFTFFQAYYIFWGD